MDDQGTGAGVRISGGHRDNKLTGDTDWQTVSYDFEVLEEVGDITFVIELRATHGRAYIDLVARAFRVEIP